MARGARKENIYNIPNALTLIRVILTFWIVWMVLHSYSLRIIVFIFLFAAFTDFLDGYFARKLNQVTMFGTAFDPLADRTLLAGTVLALILQHQLYILFLIFTREIIGLPALIFFKKGDIRFEVRPIGKLTTLFQSITVPLVILGAGFSIWFIIITAILGVFSGATYFKQALIHG